MIISVSVDGHTRKICDYIADRVRHLGAKAQVVPVDDVATKALVASDLIIIGASVRYGSHSKQVLELIETHRALLDSKANAFFSVNLTARKSEKASPETNPYVGKFLAEAHWRPHQVDVFAGALNYPAYRWFDRFFIRCIMWMTNGPTDPQTQIEYTDWARVDAFADRCFASLGRNR